jgi:hypothetical protein
MTEIDAVVKTNVSITEMLWVVPFTFDSDLIEEMVEIHLSVRAIQRKSVSYRIVGFNLISRKPEKENLPKSRFCGYKRML